MSCRLNRFQAQKSIRKNVFVLFYYFGFLRSFINAHLFYLMLVLVYSVGLTAIEAQEGHLMSFRSCAVGESTRCVESKKFCAYIVTPVFIFHISILHMTSTYYIKPFRTMFCPCFFSMYSAFISLYTPRTDWSRSRLAALHPNTASSTTTASTIEPLLLCLLAAFFFAAVVSVIYQVENSRSKHFFLCCSPFVIFAFFLVSLP